MGFRAKQAIGSAMAAGVLTVLALPAQQTSTPAPLQGQQSQQKPAPEKPDQKIDRKITPAQAKELFASVDQILSFASKDSDLSIHHAVKRRLPPRVAGQNHV